MPDEITTRLRAVLKEADIYNLRLFNYYSIYATSDFALLRR
jgi:hypothetical protein